MRFETSQHMKLGQQMKLAPRMIQSMEILQMPLDELQERIERELESNPTLEIAEPEPEALAEGVGRSLSERVMPQDFGRYSKARQSGERDAKQDAMNAAPARGESLQEQLHHQWSLVDVDERTRRIGGVIISFLEADGFLRTPLATVAERAGVGGKPVPEAEVERALQAVQLFLEPAGVAARDARECLLLQLDAMSEREDRPDPETVGQARVLIAHHLDDLMKNRLPRVAERTGYSLDQIKQALELMRRLSLAPARQLVSESVAGIIPDAIVEYDPDQDRYIAYLNDARVPNLRINQEYARLAKDKTAEQRDREFVRTNLVNAQWLMDAVNQRRQTLLRVVRAVVDAQRDYFDYGPQALKPLPMSDVAEKIGVHVATVSRAVAEKYIATPRGVVPLRKFFSGGLATKATAAELADPESNGAGGEELAWEAIKVALKDVIDAEDKRKPLSDDHLGEELKKRGIEIARRTVAKYRDQLGIPPARLRKTY